MEEKEKAAKKILNILEILYCFKCKYSEECSSEYPEYLIKCKYIEDWIWKIYSKYKGESGGKEKT